MQGLSWWWFLAVIGAIAAIVIVMKFMRAGGGQTIRLPEIRTHSSTSIEEAIGQRRSVRLYKNEPLVVTEVAQLLWACQGVTDKQRLLRATPSAGALYPLEIYLVVGDVKGLSSGIFKYNSLKHELSKMLDGDQRVALSEAAFSQQWVHQAAAAIVICANYKNVEKKYNQRAHQYVHMEVGAAAENVYLQATALGMGTVLVGAFDDDAVQKIIGSEQDEIPLCILPIGKK
ncbi:MAG: SagB/ThcOx family dehydrogenase [Candidatus Babeliales bacterium]